MDTIFVCAIFWRYKNITKFQESNNRFSLKCILSIPHTCVTTSTFIWSFFSSLCSGLTWISSLDKMVRVYVKDDTLFYILFDCSATSTLSFSDTARSSLASQNSRGFPIDSLFFLFPLSLSIILLYFYRSRRWHTQRWSRNSKK